MSANSYFISYSIFASGIYDYKVAPSEACYALQVRHYRDFARQFRAWVLGIHLPEN